MTELVSIIVPVYNVEEWLDECVESLVNQTCKNIEIILVDDGSTDKSGIKCDEWALKDDRITVVHKKNGGLSSARNAGLDVFTGDYVTFIDSDDYIEDTAIDTMLNEIKGQNVDIVRCAMNQVIGKQILDKRDMDCEKKYSKEELLKGYYYYNDGMCGSVCDKLFRSHFFNDLRFPEGLNSEDYYVLFKIYLKANGMYYDNKRFYNYRLRANSICTTNEITEHTFDKIKISDEIYRLTEKNISEYSFHAKAFQMLSRFFVYTEVLGKGLQKEHKTKWKKELRRNKKYILLNKEVSKKVQLQFFGFIYMTSLFLKMLKSNNR